MITNLIASLTIVVVTNFTETMPQVSVPIWSGDMSYQTRAEPAQNPQEKWVTTTISELQIWTFQNGVVSPVTNSVVLTNWTQHFTLEPPPAPKWIVDTNNVAPPFIWPFKDGFGGRLQLNGGVNWVLPR